MYNPLLHLSLERPVQEINGPNGPIWGHIWSSLCLLRPEPVPRQAGGANEKDNLQLCELELPPPSDHVTIFKLLQQKVEEIAVVPGCTISWVVLLRALLRIGECSWRFVVCVQRGCFQEWGTCPRALHVFKETCG